MTYEEYDLTSAVGESGLSIIKDKTMKNINWHTLRTRVLIVLTAVTAGLSAIQGMTKYDAAILVALPILMFFEHILLGNTNK